LVPEPSAGYLFTACYGLCLCLVSPRYVLFVQPGNHRHSAGEHCPEPEVTV